MNLPERIAWGVDQLDPRPSDDILEIGCGGGHALALLCQRVKEGSLTGIDRSPLQVKRARERATCARVEFCALAEAPNVLRQRFDTIFAINVNAFWTTPSQSFAAVGQMLESSGRLYLVYEPPSTGQMRKISGLLERAVADHGLVREDVRHAPLRASHGLCIVAKK